MIFFFLCVAPFQLQVVFGVWDPSLCSLTHFGSPGKVINGDHCDPRPLVIASTSHLRGSALPLRLDGETPQCEHAEIVGRRGPLLKNKRFLSFLPDKDKSRVVCMGCPAVVLFVFFFNTYTLSAFAHHCL